MPRVERWPWKENYGNDEDFLEGDIWPLVKDVALVHSSVAESYGGNIRPFPTPRENFRFVGERCFEDEHWSHEDRRCLIATEAAKIISQDKS